jgi:glycosyltransferase involved in cell wall biosynthesis
VEDVQPGDPTLRHLLRSDIPVIRWAEIEAAPGEFFREQRTDVLDTHNISVDVRLFISGCSALPPLVVSHHGSYEAASEYVTGSFVNYMRSVTSFWLYLDEKNTRPLLHHGLPTDNFLRSFNALPAELPQYQSRFEVRTQLGIADHALALVLASRAIPEKGWEIAIEVVQRLNNSNEGAAHLVLIGGGPVHERLCSVALPSCVSLCGHVDQPQRLYRGFDTGVFPSKYSGESFPRFLLECFQAGLPVVSTTIGAVPTIYGHDRATWPGGLVSHLTSADELAEAIATVLRRMRNSPATLASWRKNALATAQRFSMDKLVSFYEDVYARALQNDASLSQSTG